MFDRTTTEGEIAFQEEAAEDYYAEAERFRREGKLEVARHLVAIGYGHHEHAARLRALCPAKQKG